MQDGLQDQGVICEELEDQQMLSQVTEMGQHMLGQEGEHVGATVEVVVFLLTVAAVYHHTRAAASRNLLENEVK